MKRAEFTNTTQLGIFLGSTLTEGGSVNRSTINYHSGITELDEYLKDKSFLDKKVEFRIELYNNAVVFMLYKGQKSVWLFPLVRESIVNVKVVHGLQLNIRKDSIIRGDTLEAIAGLGAIAGGIVAVTLGALTSKSGVPKDQLVLGSIFEIEVKSENDGLEKIIVSSTDKHKEPVEYILNKILEPKIEEKKTENEKGCFIATVCYNDIDSIEVKNFRRFRDEILSKQIAGRLFIKYYYLVSPKLSFYLKNMPRTRTAIRKYILDTIHNLIK